jgi:hypothetical protein
MQVTALTTFLHNVEGMWRQGHTRDVSDFRAAELAKAGLVARFAENPASQAPTETTQATAPKKRKTKALNPPLETT